MRHRYLYLLAMVGALFFGVQRLFWEGFGFMMGPHADSGYAYIYVFLNATLLVPCVLFAFIWPRLTSAILLASTFVSASISIMFPVILGNPPDYILATVKEALPMVLVSTAIFLGRNELLTKHLTIPSGAPKFIQDIASAATVMGFIIGCLLGIVWDGCMGFFFAKSATAFAATLSVVIVLGVALATAASFGVISRKVAIELSSYRDMGSVFGPDIGHSSKSKNP